MAPALAPVIADLVHDLIIKDSPRHRKNFFVAEYHKRDNNFAFRYPSWSQKFRPSKFGNFYFKP